MFKKKFFALFVISTIIGSFFSNFNPVLADEIPSLIKDINIGDGSYPTELVVMGDYVYFSATDGNNAYELWKSDGTVDGTTMVKDIATGGGSASPSSLVNINGTLYFSAADAANGGEPWISDGTTTGTIMLKDIYSGMSSSGASSFVDVGGVTYFIANTAATGYELWKTDGTGANTVLVKDIKTGVTSSDITQMKAVGDTLYFMADDGVNGYELWKSNGTADGTTVVEDINVGIEGSYPHAFSSYNNFLYFVVKIGTGGGRELWKSDGTAENTELVKSFNTEVNSYLSNTIVMDQTLYLFVVGTAGDELWQTDGTAIGTSLVTQFNDNTGVFRSSVPNALVVIDSVLYFSDYNLVNNANVNELWKSDGTSAGTTMIKDMSTFLSVGNFVSAYGFLFFVANDGVHGGELWKSDGTLNGTVLAYDLNTDTYVPSSSEEVEECADPEDPGTCEFVIYEIAEQGSSFIQYPVVMNDYLYFQAYDGVTADHGYELWKYLTAVAPATPSISSFTKTATTLQPNWSAVDNASVYTVSSTVASYESVTTTDAYSQYTALTPNTSYNFQLKAMNIHDQFSAFSSATSTYTNPAQPLSVSVSTNGPSAMYLTWNANGNPEGTVYKVYNYSKGIVVGTTTSTNFMTTGLSADSNYYFAIRAVYNSDDISYVSSEASATVTTPPLAQAVTMTIATTTLGEAIPFSFKHAPEESHTVTLNSIVDGVASITIQSVPVTVSLGAGQSQNIDTDGNGRDETTVTMSSVGSSGASFTLSAIPQTGGMTSVITPHLNTTQTNAKAVRIDQDASETKNIQVNLEFNITDATLMAVSNDPNFEDVSFENYKATKSWTLKEGNGTKIVYVKFRSADGGSIVYSDTITLTGQTFDDPTALNTEETNTTNTADTCTLLPEHAYKTKASAGVYYITKECTKRPFKNSRTYFTYFQGWNDVKMTTDSILKTIPDDTLSFMPAGPLYNPQYGALVKTVVDPKVYLLLNDKKYWITDESVFTTLNYRWDWIEDIDQRLLNKYTTAEEIKEKTTHPQYTLIKYTNDAKVYRLEPNPTDTSLTVKRHISNEAMFKALGFRMDRIVTVPDTEVYDDGKSLETAQ